jgi:hypothetical protein
MKKVLLQVLCFVIVCFQSHAQPGNDVTKQKIAIFTPLFLDSAFDANNNYRYEKTFPRFINPGLEFYEGVQMAFDSLAKEGQPLEVFVYDTRSATQTIQEQLADAEMKAVQMIIAYNSANELHAFAYAAQKMKIPFINVNLPNDAGIYENPYFVMLNSTLRTHVESIYRYLQKHHALDELIVFRKKGQIEDMIRSYLEENEINTLSVPLKLKYVDLPDSFTEDQLTAHLDSNKSTACIAGSLDEHFGKRLALQLASVSHSYSKITLIGMPTFSNIESEFSRPEYKVIPIIYSTPFYNPRTDSVSQRIVRYFSATMYARPSDMVMRGYEAAWRFSKLLLKYKSEIASNLTRKEFNVFREFDIRPVLGKPGMTLDYYENKKLFFLRWQDGTFKLVH